MNAWMSQQFRQSMEELEDEILELRRRLKQAEDTFKKQRDCKHDDIYAAYGLEVNVDRCRGCGYEWIF